MLRSVAVQRINDGLGFRPSGNSLEATIILRLKEAQRDLEAGKTLPAFLLQEEQTLSLASGTHTVALPTGFLRESDESRIRFYPEGSVEPVFLSRRYFIDALQANLSDTLTTDAPSVYVIRQSTIDFIVTANDDFTLYWDYYKAAALLDSDIENAWLKDTAPNRGAPEWLIGEAGWRLAKDLGNANAVALFNDLRTAGRAACFGESLAAEQASGPLAMGANL